MFFQALGLLVLILAISFGKVIYDFVRQSRKVREMGSTIARIAVELTEARLSNTRNFNLRQLAVRHLFAARGLVRRLKMGVETLRASLEMEIAKHEKTRRVLDEEATRRERVSLDLQALREMSADRDDRLDVAEKELSAAKIKIEGWERAIERVKGFDMVTAREAIMTGTRFEVLTVAAADAIRKGLDVTDVYVKRLEEQAEVAANRIEELTRNVSNATARAEAAEHRAADLTDCRTRLEAVIEKGRDSFFSVTENIPDLSPLLDYATSDSLDPVVKARRQRFRSDLSAALDALPAGASVASQKLAIAELRATKAVLDVTENIPDLPEFAIFRRFSAFAEERNAAMLKKGDDLANVAAKLATAERLASDRAVTISERDVSIRELRMRAVTPFVWMLLGQVSNISDYDGKSITGKRFRLVETRKTAKKKGGAK